MSELQRFILSMQPYLDSHNRASSVAQEKIYEFEKLIDQQPRDEVYFAFQKFVGRVGAKLSHPPLVGDNGDSYWLRDPHFLSNFRSTPELPQHVSVLIIGSGLAGLGAAEKAGEIYSNGGAQKGFTYAIVDKNGVAEGASSHSGGNKQPALERFIKWYQGLVSEREKFLKLAFPWMEGESLYSLAVAQAKEILQFGQANSALMNRIVEEYGIDAHESFTGWMRRSNRAFDEVALENDTRLYNEVGIPSRYLLADQMEVETGLVNRGAGRLTPDYGNYDPYEMITQAFEALLKRGAQIYTQTEVTDIDWSTPVDQPVLVHTSRGDILADKVIVATDAYGSKLMPELSVIEPYQSHILLFEHVENTLQGRTITEWDGDLYFNGPRATWYVDVYGKKRMMLLVGGGPDQRMNDMDNPKMLPASYEVIVQQITDIYPELVNQPPSDAWTFGFGFNPDGAMIWGPLQYRRDGKVLLEPRVFIAGGGSEGYGGSTQVRAGYGAVEWEMASTNEARTQVQVAYDPLDMFQMGRFVSDQYVEAHDLSRACLEIF